MAKANAAIKMMEITASQMVQVALNQGNIAFWVQVCAEDARNEFYFATNSLSSLCRREAELELGLGLDSDGDSIFPDDNEDEDETVDREEGVCGVCGGGVGHVWVGNVHRSLQNASSQSCPTDWV